MSAIAQRERIALLQPERVGDPAIVESLRSTAPDLGVVVAFGQFLPKPIRELPKLGYLINGHASLLPRLRGAGPIVRAILEAEPRTGVSVMRVEREMDAGAVALQRELKIDPRENAGELAKRLAILTADAIAEAVEAIAGDRVTWTPQDPARATFAPKIEREDARLDWSRSAEQLARRVRAMAPTPGAFTALGSDTLRILAARSEPGPTDRPPGTVQHAAGAPLRIATGDGWLVPLRVQRAGGKTLEIEAYLRGRRIPDGERLGTQPTARLA